MVWGELFDAEGFLNRVFGLKTGVCRCSGVELPSKRKFDIVTYRFLYSSLQVEVVAMEEVMVRRKRVRGHPLLSVVLGLNMTK